jgi:hypothetical protein
MAKRCQIVRFTVEGRGHFPADMLRYDACYPQSEDDSGKIMQSLYTGDAESREIRLAHRVLKDEYLANYPTEGRWQSFGWRVVPLTVSKSDY